MDRLCNKCAAYRKEYDEFRQEYVDVDEIGSDAPEPHFCTMYDDHIPTPIYYDGAPCAFFMEE